MYYQLAPFGTLKITQCVTRYGIARAHRVQTLRTFGRIAGIVSASVLAVLPASVIIDTRNEPDALVAFCLLLAAVCIVKAVQTSQWKWGSIHQVEFHHSLSVKKPLDRVFNRGPFPIGGDTDTVFQTAYNPSAPYHATEWCPSVRLIMDVGKWDNSFVISPPGQIGVLGSEHFEDFASLWLEGKYIPMLWSFDKVESFSKNKLELSPKE